MLPVNHKNSTGRNSSNCTLKIPLQFNKSLHYNLELLDYAYFIIYISSVNFRKKVDRFRTTWAQKTRREDSIQQCVCWPDLKEKIFYARSLWVMKNGYCTTLNVKNCEYMPANRQHWLQSLIYMQKSFAKYLARYKR